MPADLAVALDGGSFLLQVHALQDGILAKPLLHHQCGFLEPVFLLLRRFSLGFLLFQRCVISKQVKLYRSFRGDILLAD